MTPCAFIIRVGRRLYRVVGTLPSDTPTAAERTAAGEAARVALFTDRGIGPGYSYTDQEPDWAAAVGVVQSVEWTRTAAA